jgi:pimeloyl-ACP methyl ester carboxylesterase
MAFFRDKKSALHYLVRGHGEPLLFIHGLGGSGADWAFQVAALEKRFRVIVPDLPGSGHSPPPRNGYSSARYGGMRPQRSARSPPIHISARDLRWRAGRSAIGSTS